jgi:cyclic-di-AMP phosphodiesterase PgpH
VSWFHRNTPRREAIRARQPAGPAWRRWAKDRSVFASLGIALAFALAAGAIVMTRPAVTTWRPGQFVPHDVTSRVEFTYFDAARRADEQQRQRDAAPRVYVPEGDKWAAVEEKLLVLPQRVAELQPEQIDADLKPFVDGPTLVKLQEIAARGPGGDWEESVHGYVGACRKLNLVVIPDGSRRSELGRSIRLSDRGSGGVVRADAVLSPTLQEELAIKFTKPAIEGFGNVLYPSVVRLTISWLGTTHTPDEAATAEARNAAAAAVPATAGEVRVRPGQMFVRAGEIDVNEWRLLRAEQRAYQEKVGGVWGQRGGLLASVLVLTIALAAYVARDQPRVVRNHARATGVAALLLSMLLLAQLAALGSSPLYIFAVTPTIIAAMILAIAYDQRFALVVGLMHALLVTLGTGASPSFFLILLVGIVACCGGIDELRTRDKLIRVGGVTGLALGAAAAASGLVAGDPISYLGQTAMYAATSGLIAGFLVQGILPFIERAFRITTGMTLLELADVSQPLLRRLASDAPGTWSHSLNVATLAEQAAEAIGADALLCRCGAYYHDVGKVNKPNYFMENQQGQDANRHLNLSPSVSLLIIIGHVKDGVQLAREAGLPTILHSFIEQHHGTTLIEFFYREACSRSEKAKLPLAPEVSQEQYRYPGPKPRSRETAILMLCDAVESACRAMTEPTAGRIEGVVHELTMRRLSDGQFDECPITMKELGLIERSLVRTLTSLYHGRVAYPSTKALTDASTLPAAATA